MCAMVSEHQYMKFSFILRVTTWRGRGFNKPTLRKHKRWQNQK